jgi:hypothetical protein
MFMSYYPYMPKSKKQCCGAGAEEPKLRLVALATAPFYLPQV